eukprot:gene673-36188_t
MPTGAGGGGPCGLGMGPCMSLFYDTTECRWEETLLAQAVLQASLVEHKRDEPVSSIDDLTDSDFTELRNVPECRELQPSGGGRLLVWEYAPRVFRFFRESPRFCNCISQQDWEESWKDTAQACTGRAQVGPGKSGATNDAHWMIKTIDVKEVQKQIGVLREYLLKLQERNEQGKPTNVAGSADLHQAVVRHPPGQGLHESDDQDKEDTFVYNVWDLKGRQPKPGKL